MFNKGGVQIKAKSFISFFAFVMSMIFSVSLFTNFVSADSRPESCTCKDNCLFCKLFCSGEECYCTLFVIILFLFIFIIILMVTFIILRTIQKHRLANEENDEFVRKYRMMVGEDKRIKKAQRDLEAKINGETGYEDVVFQLVKPGEAEGDGSLIVEMLQKDEKKEQDLTFEIQPPEEKKKNNDD